MTVRLADALPAAIQISFPCILLSFTGLGLRTLTPHTCLSQSRVSRRLLVVAVFYILSCCGAFCLELPEQIKSPRGPASPPLPVVLASRRLRPQGCACDSALLQLLRARSVALADTFTGSLHVNLCDTCGMHGESAATESSNVRLLLAHLQLIATPVCFVSC